MKYYRLKDSSGNRLVLEDDEIFFDLTSNLPYLDSFRQLVFASEISNTDIDQLSRRIKEDSKEIEKDRVEESLKLPVLPSEVWAAGVTYKISEEGRKSESKLPDIYREVYESERPELFFKSTTDRTVGPGESVGIRGDSDWNVPEPELGVVLYYGKIVGYTIGNDMSSRDIEGSNPLYLPQAKVYDRSCALGPCVATTETVRDPHELEMEMEIEREGEVVFEGSASTSEMMRTCDELVSYYTRHNEVSNLSVLLTGTCIVPPEEFTLREDDLVGIKIDKIGTLENTVVEV